jgi:SAM-dependent methyltransferase
MYYGADQAAIHHERFGSLAREAATLVQQRLSAAGITGGVVVDLGSGSGIFARAMTNAGFDVIGVDISADMVAIAREHAPAATFTIGSLHDFPLPHGVVAVTALGEVCNYATDARAGLDALRMLASRAADALEPGGLFVFDVATPGRGTMGQRFHQADSWSLGVLMDEHDDVLERAITIFVRDGDLYRRVDEHHVLRLYEPHDVQKLLRDAGFEVEMLDGDAAPAPFSGWKVFVSQCSRRTPR